jgi:hypothetical protein
MFVRGSSQNCGTSTGWPGSPQGEMLAVGIHRLWSVKSPDLASRKKEMQKLFSEYEQIEVNSLTVQNAMMKSEKAKIRVDLPKSSRDEDRQVCAGLWKNEAHSALRPGRGTVEGLD